MTATGAPDSHLGGADGAALLDADEPPAYLRVAGDDRSEFVVVVDHASARIPRRLGDLGVAAAERQRHIAWDIGALGIATRLATALCAPLIAQNYSRLVIDCNRDPAVPSSIPVLSEWTPVPGNVALTPAARAQRRLAIFDPYHEQIRALLAERLARGQRTILIAQHTMTDVYKGLARPMHAAILYNRDRGYAGAVLDALRQDSGLVIADNEPYFVSDETDYTIPHHAEARRLPHVEIEVRQDLLADPAGQELWARRIAAALLAARDRLFGGG